MNVEAIFMTQLRRLTYFYAVKSTKYNIKNIVKMLRLLKLIYLDIHAMVENKP